MKHVVDRGPSKSWMSYDQIFQYINKVPEKLEEKFPTTNEERG